MIKKALHGIHIGGNAVSEADTKPKEVEIASSTL